MPNLDILYLKEFLLYITNSNWIIYYMVGNLVPIPFQWYMEVPLTLQKLEYMKEFVKLTQLECQVGLAEILNNFFLTET